MAVIFSEDWELVNFSRWAVHETNGATVTMTVDAVAARKGAYGLNISGLTAGGDYGICRADLASPRTDLHLRAYVKFTQELAVGTMMYLLQHDAFGEGASDACLVRNADGSYQWMVETYDGVNWIDYRSPTFNGPIAGKEICLEFYTYKSLTAGQVAVWVDGVQVINQTGINTGAAQITALRVEAWHVWGNPNAGSVYFDDVVAADAYVGPDTAITGVLSVTATKNAVAVAASVSVDTQTGVTPVSFTLAAGTYSVTATYAGVPLTQSATVIAGQTTTITFDFSVVPNPGFITVNAFSDSTAIAANISADGQTGVTPVTFSFPAGTYSVTATYQSQTLPAQTVTLNAGQTVTVNFHFLPATHQLTILGASGGTTNPLPGVLTLDVGTVQPVVPLPNSGYRHKSWLFDGVNQDPWWPAGSTIYITMDADHTIQAEFELLPPLEFTLTISSTTGGSTSPLSGTYIQIEGSSVSVSAIADSGYKFDHWTLDGGNAGSTNPISITMNANHTLQAVFAVTTFTLAISATVGGTTTPAPGTYTIQQGLTQQVAATTASGYQFVNWLLDGNARAENPISVTMDTDHTLQAVFAVVTYTLTISATAGGTTSPSPSTYTIQEGGSQQVAAIPSSGYSFTNWQLDGVVRTENPITVTMNTNHTLLATFEALLPPPPQKQYLTISSVNGQTSPVAGTYELAKDSSVTITCTPNSGYRFREWLLDNVPVGTAPSYTVVMNVNHGLVAVCEEIPSPPTYTLFISAGNGGTTHPVPGTYQYTQGTIVNVAPIPDSDYRFANWTLDSQAIADNPINVTMNADHSLMAVFEALPPPPPQKQYLTIVAINGQTNPSQGIYQLDTNSVITITATPNSGFRFKEWLLDNVSAGTQPTIVVAMNANHTLVALFEEIPQPIVAGFPIWTIPATLIVVGIVYLATKKK